MGAQGAETNKKRRVSARRGNTSSLTSLRPVPYTLHSFTCSHVDGLWPRPLYVFIYECCYVGRNIYSPGLWDSHPCSAWSMRGNTKSKAEWLPGAGCPIAVVGRKSWGGLLGAHCAVATLEPRIRSSTPGSMASHWLVSPRISPSVSASIEIKLEMLRVALRTICTMMLRTKMKI